MSIGKHVPHLVPADLGQGGKDHEDQANGNGDVGRSHARGLDCLDDGRGLTEPQPDGRREEDPPREVLVEE